MELPFAYGRLRPLSDADVGPMALGLNDRAVWRNVRDSLPHPYAESDARAFLERTACDDGSHVFAIEVDGTLVGAIGLHRKDDVYRRTAELGFWIARSSWGRGIASAAVPEFVRHGLEHWPDVVRVEGQVFAWNRASMRVLQKSGFTHEGRLRDAVAKDGEITDLFVFSLLRREVLEARR